MFESFKDAVDKGLTDPLNVTVSISRRLGLFINDNWHDENQMIRWINEISELPEDVKNLWVSEVRAFTCSLIHGVYDFKFSDPDVALMFLCYPTGGGDEVFAKWEDSLEVDDNLSALLKTYKHIEEDCSQEHYRSELLAFYRLVAEQNLYLKDIFTHVKHIEYTSSNNKLSTKCVYTSIKQKMFS